MENLAIKCQGWRLAVLCEDGELSPHQYLTVPLFLHHVSLGPNSISWLHLDLYTTNNVKTAFKSVRHICKQNAPRMTHSLSILHPFHKFLSPDSPLKWIDWRKRFDQLQRGRELGRQCQPLSMIRTFCILIIRRMALKLSEIPNWRARSIAPFLWRTFLFSVKIEQTSHVVGEPIARRGPSIVQFVVPLQSTPWNGSFLKCGPI